MHDYSSNQINEGKHNNTEMKELSLFHLLLVFFPSPTAQGRPDFYHIGGMFPLRTVLTTFRI
jgi:hypothetical protein